MNGTPALWSSVLEGDRVLAADGMWWECTSRRHGRLTLERAGRDPVTRRPPAGAVRVIRGEHGAAIATAAAVFVGAGLTVEVLPDW